MRMNRTLYIGALFVAVLGALGAMQFALAKAANAQGDRVQAPTFQVDPVWPKPYPNHWVLGGVIGVAVDAQDHVWIVQRPGTLNAVERAAALNPPTAECCVPAPP